MDEATARNVLQRMDACVDTMEENNTKMLETIHENLKVTAEMKGLKGLIEQHLRKNDELADGNDTTLITSNRDMSVTSVSGDESDLGVDVQSGTGDEMSQPATDDATEDSDDSVELLLTDDEDHPRKKRRLREPGDSSSQGEPDESANLVAQPAHATKSIPQATTFEAPLPVFYMHPTDGKLQASDFQQRYPDLFRQSLLQIEEISKLSYWKSYINPVTKSCMNAYVKFRVPANKVRWSDTYPHRQPCKLCSERSLICIVLDNEGTELVVLGPQTKQEE
ncbi:hypothetical protein IWZ01DRAFT_548814 [Phyllosticta capitalensis]